MKKGHTEATYEFPINNMLLGCANRAGIYGGESTSINNLDALEIAKAIVNGSIDIDSHRVIYLMTVRVWLVLCDFVPDGETKEEVMFRTWVFNGSSVFPSGKKWCSYYNWNEKETKFEIRTFDREKMEEEFKGKLDGVVLLESFFTQ